MGCDNSKGDVANGKSSKKSGSGSKAEGKEKDKRSSGSNGTANTGGGGSSAAAGAAGGRQPLCHFCHKRIPEKEYNAHTVMCDEREVTCWNSWCRQIVRQGDLQKHLEECGKKQRAICPKCGKSVLALEMTSHRDGCNPKPCPQCGEVCIQRLHKWCPTLLLQKFQTSNNGPFADEALQKKYRYTPAAEGAAAAAAKDHKNVTQPQMEYNVARMQLLWRWMKLKALVEEGIFRSVYKEIDLKKEGFAIFKAHDKVTDSHVLAPKRSRSLITNNNPVVAPATSSHYFPVNPQVPITSNHIERMIADLKRHVLLPYPAAWRVLTEAMNHFNTMPNIVRISPPIGAHVTSTGRVSQGCKVIVVGDLHGQLADLLHILNECGMPSESNYYVFNGDFVDRGACGVEILLVLFALMLAFPKFVTLNRGNHECDYMNDEYGFDVEVSTKYDRNVFRLIQRCFCALPLATIIGGKIFVVHGGLPRRKGVTLNDISRIQRFRQVPMPNYSQPEEDEIFQDMLWSDPVEDIKGWRESQRGAGVEFGSDVTLEFLRNNKLEKVVRSHEECISGYEEMHEGKLITIFSCSNYDGPDTNFGAVCTFIWDSMDPSYHAYQVAEDDYEAEQMMNLTDSFSLGFNGASPTVLKGGSFTGKSGSSFVGPSTVRLLLMRRRAKDDILRELRERIYQRRHRLLSYFSRLDRTNTGSLWMIEWVESMSNVLNLNLPWYFLRGYFIEVDDKSRVKYAYFLYHYHSMLQSLYEEGWRQTICARVLQQQRSNHRSQLVTAAFKKDIVSYNEFCSVLRTIDYTMSDAQLFQLFRYFDLSSVGHISGPEFVKKCQTFSNAMPDPLHWDLDAMEQFQNIVIQARNQMPSLFKVSTKDKSLTRERFTSGMTQLARGMRKQLTPGQREAIYDYLVNFTCNTGFGAMVSGNAANAAANPGASQKSGEGEVTFDCFLLAVYIFDSRSLMMLKSHSLAEMHELGLGGILRNMSFSSNQTAATGH